MLGPLSSLRKNWSRLTVVVAVSIWTKGTLIGSASIDGIEYNVFLLFFVNNHIQGKTPQMPQKGEDAMKTKEELNALKKEYESLRVRLSELSEDELAHINGGASMGPNVTAVLGTAVSAGVVLKVTDIGYK